MKVKITKCMIESFWYNDLIGCEFEVENFDEVAFRVKNSFKLIEKQDCKVLSSDHELSEHKNFKKIFNIHDYSAISKLIDEQQNVPEYVNDFVNNNFWDLI